ncbi:MAG TPA: hypothetical protein VLX61_15415 [Anaerolineales bacterium]|nr:hypothetical protein [Anaerolineales bacterium]
MIVAIVSWTVVAGLLITSAGLLLYRDWRWGLALLVGQYAGVFWLVLQHWPLGMAAAKLVGGWMAAASLGITLLNLPQQADPVEKYWTQGRAFRLFMVGMAALLAAAAAPSIEAMLPGTGIPVAMGGILLTAMGLLQLGMTTQVLRVILGLLTALSGFEILYAAMEGSSLVAGLLVVVNLGLGLVGAYLLIVASAEKTE